MADTVNPRATLQAIADRLSGVEWDSDTCDDIARILRDAGFTVAETPQREFEVTCDPGDGQREVRSYHADSVQDALDQAEQEDETAGRTCTYYVAPEDRAQAFADGVVFDERNGRVL